MSKRGIVLTLICSVALLAGCSDQPTAPAEDDADEAALHIGHGASRDVVVFKLPGDAFEPIELDCDEDGNATVLRYYGGIFWAQFTILRTPNNKEHWSWFARYPENEQGVPHQLIDDDNGIVWTMVNGHTNGMQLSPVDCGIYTQDWFDEDYGAPDCQEKEYAQVTRWREIARYTNEDGDKLTYDLGQKFRTNRDGDLVKDEFWLTCRGPY